MSTETKKKGSGAFKYILLIEMLIFVGAIIAALVIIFSSIFGEDPSTDIDRMMIGVYILYGSMGYIPFIVAPTLILMFTRRKNNMFSSLQSFKLSKIGPYAPGYKPSGVKKPRFCEYCGYEVILGERECPECGGPVKAINSSYI
ncbi:MAG: zinc ribbon domain-containing protein [Candidatus Heimdallarchaeota archaeon]|nr:zinc ribbon domain-containing protein [Candidatus Heimdallarchaeota archaeon]